MLETACSYLQLKVYLIPHHRYPACRIYKSFIMASPCLPSVRRSAADGHSHTRKYRCTQLPALSFTPSPGKAHSPCSPRPWLGILAWPSASILSWAHFAAIIISP